MCRDAWSLGIDNATSSKRSMQLRTGTPGKQHRNWTGARDFEGALHSACWYFAPAVVSPLWIPTSATSAVHSRNSAKWDLLEKLAKTEPKYIFIQPAGDLWKYKLSKGFPPFAEMNSFVNILQESLRMERNRWYAVSTFVLWAIVIAIDTTEDMAFHSRLKLLF